MNKLKIEHVVGGYIIPFYGSLQDEESCKKEALTTINKVKAFDKLCSERSISEIGCTDCPASDLCYRIIKELD